MSHSIIRVRLHAVTCPSELLPIIYGQSVIFPLFSKAFSGSLLELTLFPKSHSAHGAGATEERTMLSWAITFFIIAIIAAILGFGGIAGSASSIAQILFLVFLVLAVVSFFRGRSAKL